MLRFCLIENANAFIMQNQQHKHYIIAVLAQQVERGCEVPRRCSGSNPEGGTLAPRGATEARLITNEKVAGSNPAGETLAHPFQTGIAG